MSFSGHETLNIRIYNLFLELILMINRARCITLEELLQKKRNQT